MRSNGNRSRRNGMARNNGVSSTSSGQQGLAVRTRAANGPACESSRALDGASSSRRTALWPKSSTAWDAERCQPRVGSRDGSSSAGTGGAGGAFPAGHPKLEVRSRAQGGTLAQNLSAASGASKAASELRRARSREANGRFL